MEIRVRRDDLVTELTLLSGIVERRTTIPILSHLRLDATDEGLALAATDLDVSLLTSCRAEVSAPGTIAVGARKFTEIVRALPDEEVEIAVEETQLTIRGGRSRFKIRGLDAASFPGIQRVEGDVVAEVALPLLRRMIAKVVFAISTEESRFQLNGALVKVGGKGLEMVATDGHRLALVEAPAGDGATLSPGAAGDGVLVPRKALQELLRFDGEGAVAYRRGEHHLSFRLGKRELVCRILEGTFPDYERVIARHHDKKPVLDRAAVQQAVQRVALLTGERSRGVLLALAPELLTVSAANPDLGEASEQVPCVYDGPEVKLGINPEYLGQFLAAVETERVRLEVKDGESQCVGFPEGEGDLGYLCVIMPMHV